MQEEGDEGGGTPVQHTALLDANPRGSGAKPSAYRQRAATTYRGVTKTSGTNSGVEKYDVQ